MLKVEHLSYDVVEEGRQSEILSDVSFTVNDGEMLVITGPNGGGKSTLAKLLMGLISTSSLAVGVMVISMTTGMNTDVYNYMFGSILAMSAGDVRLSVALAVVVLALYIFFYHKIFAITFDETFAQATGVKADLYNTLIAVLTAVTIVLGMRMMGALLISSLIIFPALTSMRVCRTFKSVIINSAVIAVVCLVIGITVSYVWATPAGASVVMANIAALLLYSLLGVAKNRKSR